MRLTIACIGRLKNEPEAQLAADWLSRARLSGRAHGLSDVQVIELDVPGGKLKEGEALLARLPEGAHLFALDEHGRDLTSRALADRLAELRDTGPRDIAFVIGGADGLSPALTARAQETIAFGRQTWPHRLVRAMLAEQIYRAVTLWAGSPYHRD